MRALLTVVAVLMVALLLGASFLALNDLANPNLPDKSGSVILWLIFFVPTVAAVHFAWFRGKAS